MSDRKYNVVIFGASGFTGRLVAEYMQKEYSQSQVKWAVAGRNIEKLKEVLAEIDASDVDCLRADTSDSDSLVAMAKQADVVLTTVGPYQLYGEDLVKACVEVGTHYVDLCGEPAWMHKMINTYEEQAKQSGAKIVFSCGFDSVPFDLGLYFLQEHVAAETGSTLPYVKGRVRKMQGTFSGGTAASLQATMKAAFADPEVMKLLKHPHSLANTDKSAEQPSGDKPYFDEKLQSWAAPFIMAAINTKNIHRSNMLLDYKYTEGFRYDEMLLTGPGDQGEKMAKHVAQDKSLASDSAPKPGEGPSKEERENGFYDVLFIGEHENGKTYAAGVTGDKDPGYGSTSKIIAESAICLATQTEDLKGGFYTPAPAFGNTLIQRLVEKAGLTFTIEK